MSVLTTTVSRCSTATAGTASPWSDIKGFAMNTGAPWPTLVTNDDERVMLFGIQGSDGAYAREAVAYLRSRLTRS